MKDIEELGAFYLGRTWDPERQAPTGDPLLYDSKDLTTHALCVGMTGSGKTGLCVGLLEEAALDGVPAIAIDPKGDLANLLLTFPGLAPSDFLPWVEPGEAARKGQTPEAYAASTAAKWREGIESWGQDASRIARLRSAVDLAIYTPGSDAGLPLTVLRSFTAPPATVRADGDAVRARVTTAVSGLLALLGIEADPLRSREHILLSTILDRVWRDGRDLDLPGLIRAVQEPPVERVGVLDLESFYPGKDRFELAMTLNNVLASPGFAAWTQGEPLDIGRLLWTPTGKPRISILSIAHLGDAERMFFVSLLLNEVVSWMRTQAGTPSLRALLYMDEVFGYFPPTANPPSKAPMLTLLKQARAFGLGVVLSTQNPVDLDYKGLSNCGTWFLGRLQTERDKARVLDGLEGVSTTTGSGFDRKAVDRALSGLPGRVFLMHDVHEDEPVLFHTRWALSYLRGPLTRDQISTLMADRKQTAPVAAAAASKVAADPAGARPVLPPGIEEKFLPVAATVGAGERLLYRPSVIGLARLHHVRARLKVDSWSDVALLATIDEDPWPEAEAIDPDALEFHDEPEGDASFGTLPDGAAGKTAQRSWTSKLKQHLYREHALTVRKCARFKGVSEPGETAAEFRARMAQAAREHRDVQVEKLRTRYAPKLARLQERIRKAQIRVQREKSQYAQKKTDVVISVGSTLLGALFGRKAVSSTSVGKAATAARSVGRARRERGDIARAAEDVEAAREALEAMELEFEGKIDACREPIDSEALEIDEIEVRPRKADIEVGRVGLAWVPWRVGQDGLAEPAYR